MARPNYSHSKRQRELVKKQKREEKLQRKIEKKNAPTQDQGDNPQPPPPEPGQPT